MTLRRPGPTSTLLCALALLLLAPPVLSQQPGPGAPAGIPSVPFDAASPSGPAPAPSDAPIPLPGETGHAPSASSPGTDVPIPLPVPGVAPTTPPPPVTPGPGATKPPAAPNWSGPAHPVPSKLSADLLDVFFSTSKVGFAVGRRGAIYHTQDGGHSWQPQDSGTLQDLHSVYFTGTKLGWACGDQGVLLRTQDGGSTWAAQSLQDAGVSGDALNRVVFIGPENGWICGTHGLLLHTEDGGTTWKLRPSGTRHNLEGMVWKSSDDGWIVGGATIVKGSSMDVILHTADGGKEWTSQPTGLANDYLRNVFFVNSRTGWAVGDAVLTTTNGGKTWANASQAFQNVHLYSVAFETASVGWIGGAQGALYTTRDGGHTWKRQAIGTNRDIRGIFLYDNTQVAVGATGEAGSPDRAAVLRTEDDGKNWLH